MRNKAMLIGAVRAGKSTLTNALLGRKVEAFKTQTLNYYDWIVDTPGEYTENPMFYKNIMATALEVTHVLYLQDATSEKLIFPPGFSMGIPKLPIGVVTKCDLPEAKSQRALDMLKTVMNEGPIVMVSSVTGQGIDHLRELTKMNSLTDMRQYVMAAEDEHLLFIG
ncbi:ethanolamine utilization protein EutP [Sporosarcina sp. P37]|uniref:EutP/PduV family microcompartment system protein n=1 Tax=unclassified Sporosarcina TaxID=2647733 RepID=UPI0009BDE610|nr:MULTISPECIES: EutP/PduV family microcompartment system protein [unclassified Sporosarcina]ARD48261.1 ethanolamine utilization protein EutP [Sporosarcina sp. P33]ARK24775.1 ethanolamine utilization protein EutP [Sporosarcina sp. P37]PID19934.1 ethanolamine utilization protein EutP [Sporosarcina sp. P35]